MNLVAATAGLALALLGVAEVQARAAEVYPDRPVQMIVPVGAGGSTDTIMRGLVQYAAPLLGQPIIILNRPGASGMIGVNDVTRATPDGYTVGGTWSGPLTMAPHVVTARYEPSDWVIVAMITKAPGVLCVAPGFPASNGHEFLEELRREPDKYTYGADGIGGFVQFAAERIFVAANVHARMIPFPGADQTVTAFLSGTIDMYGGAITTILPFVKEGKAKCMIVTSAKRFAALPDVDSVSDVGLAETQTLLWRAVIAPAGLPADRLLKLREVFRRAMSDPGFKTFAEARGEETWPADSINENTFAHNEFITVERLADKLKLMAAP